MARGKGPGPSQADLAAALEISVSTVSRALSNAPGISDEIRRKVARAARDLGYRTRNPAPMNRLERVAVIATLFDVNSTLAWVYQEMLSGITGACEKMDLPVEPRMTGETDRIPQDLANALDPGTGVAFLGCVPNRDTIAWLAERDISAVIVNGVDPGLKVDSVSPANYFGGRLVAEHLLSLGHRQMLFVGGAPRWTLIRRYHGFRDALADSEGRIAGTLHLGHDTAQGHVRQIADWLRQCPKEATAVFCYNDSIAMCAMEAVHSLGLGVPDDIAIVGFDDMPMATMCTPPLTTFRIDWRSIGSEAVQLLARRRMGESGLAREMQVGGELILRTSTGGNANFA